MLRACLSYLASTETTELMKSITKNYLQKDSEGTLTEKSSGMRHQRASPDYFIILQGDNFIYH